jgi:hypothetical protein
MHWLRERKRHSSRTILAGLIAFLPVALLNAPAVAQVDTAIGVRNAHVTVYDGMRREVILVAGADERQVLGSTWSWNGTHWREIAADGPTPRTFAAIAADPARTRVFLFGGNRVLFGSGHPGDTVLGDFWMWNGARWVTLDASGPGSRAEAAMTFDRSRGRLVLFGGYRGGGGQRVRLGDTWEWDGKAWSLAATTGPTPRNNAAMVYDSDRRVSVLFGGSDGSASGETWEWDGMRWSRSSAPRVDGRYNPVMVFDPVRHRVVRFGGWNGRERLGDTWTFDGLRWTREETVGPSARNHAAFAFDYARGRAVLFGGHDGSRVFGDTWEWLGDRWLMIDSVPSRQRVDNGH